MSSLIFWIVVLAVLQGIASALPRRLRSRRRSRRSEDYESENLGAAIWEGICQVIIEKAPWLPIAWEILFWSVFIGVGLWVYLHQQKFFS